MRIQTWLRRTADAGIGYSLVLRNTLVKAASRIDDLETELRSHRRHHHHCDDSWYCCGKCDSSDHGGLLDSHDGESARVSGVCNCGADATNERIDRLLEAGEMDSQKEPGTTFQNVSAEKMGGQG